MKLLAIWYSPSKAVSVGKPIFTEIRHWTLYEIEEGVDIFLKLYIHDSNISLEKLKYRSFLMNSLSFVDWVE
jgi:hypothetical protein